MGRSDQAGDIYRLRNGGSAGVADRVFYDAATAFMDRHRAPAAARDAMAFRYAIGAWDFAAAAAAADRLLPTVLDGQRWIGSDELRDGTVIAKLHVGDVAGARRLYDALAPLTCRAPDDLRSQLLAAYILTSS